MVRYPRGHKEKTREQIVSAAARAFREEGVGGVDHKHDYWAGRETIVLLDNAFVYFTPTPVYPDGEGTAGLSVRHHPDRRYRGIEPEAQLLEHSSGGGSVASPSETAADHCGKKPVSR